MDDVTAPKRDKGYYLILGGQKPSAGQLSRFSKRMRKERGGKCERCGKNGSALHHIFEKAKYPAFALKPENVLVLCGSCHGMATMQHQGWRLPDEDFYSLLPKSVMDRIQAFRDKVAGGKP